MPACPLQAGGQVGRRAGGQAGGSADRQTDRQAGWLVGGWAGWLAGWQGWQASSLTGCQAGWLAGRPEDRLAGQLSDEGTSAGVGRGRGKGIGAGRERAAEGLWQVKSPLGTCTCLGSRVQRGSGRAGTRPRSQPPALADNARRTRAGAEPAAPAGHSFSHISI